MKHATYHNHTSFSDGAESPRDFLQIAVPQGVEVLGFADHYYRNPADNDPFPDWALKPAAEEAYFAAIAELRDAAPIEVCTGLEFDWLEGSAPWLAPMAKDPRLDYTIGSIHCVGDQTFDLSRAFWEGLSQEEINVLVRRYWSTVRAMAESRLFEIAGHLDLIKKFNYHSTEDLRPLIAEALDAIKAADMVVELNTSGWNKDCREAYPTEAILKECFRREIPVMVSADAHQAALATAHFARAYDLLSRVGYTHLARFRQRERFAVPLG